MLRISMALAALIGAVASAQAATVVPTVYEAGHFFATPTLANGQVLRLLVDTGGGGVNYWLQESTAARLGLQKVSCPELADAPLVTAPEYQPGKGLPRPKTYCGAISALVPEGGIDTKMDGMVGSSYLPDHIWTFDYLRRTLSIEAPNWTPPDNARALHMNLPATRKGQVRQSFPRITVTIAGESVDMLLDTGATARPTRQGLAIMGTSVVNGEGTTSYATARFINRWHEAHPDWTVLDNADELFGPKARAAGDSRAVRRDRWLGGGSRVVRPTTRCQFRTGDVVHDGWDSARGDRRQRPVVVPHDPRLRPRDGVAELCRTMRSTGSGH